MKKLLTIICASLLFAACGGSGTNSGGGNSSKPEAAKTDAAKSSKGIEIKIKEKPYAFEQKAGALFSNDMTINFPDRNAKRADRQFIIANYEADSSMGAFMMGKKMTAPEQIRFNITLTDAEGTDKTKPISVGTYGKSKEEFSKILNIWIFTYADGTDAITKMDAANDDFKGDVKITAVNGDTITGEIDVSNKDASVKGSFTAKEWKNK